jgi:hypothetical protein
MIPIIGLCGFARSGKNSFADFIGHLGGQSDPPISFKNVSFAYALRKELDSFLQEKIGISAFTEDLKEKEIIRPLLVCWGTSIIRNKIDKNYWVENLKNTVNNNRKTGFISIITDVRFVNELKWIKKEGGVSIFVERDGVGPTNPDELKFTDPLKKQCDLTFKWNNLSAFESAGAALVKKFVQKHNLCQLTLPTRN